MRCCTLLWIKVMSCKGEGDKYFFQVTVSQNFPSSVPISQHNHTNLCCNESCFGIKREQLPLIEHSSEIVVGSVVGHGFGVQGSVDGWLSSFHCQSIQLHCGGDATCNSAPQNHINASTPMHFSQKKNHKFLMSSSVITYFSVLY